MLILRWIYDYSMKYSKIEIELYQKGLDYGMSLARWNCDGDQKALHNGKDARTCRIKGFLKETSTDSIKWACDRFQVENSLSEWYEGDG